MCDSNCSNGILRWIQTSQGWYCEIDAPQGGVSHSAVVFFLPFHVKCTFQNKRKYSLCLISILPSLLLVLKALLCTIPSISLLSNKLHQQMYPSPYQTQLIWTCEVHFQVPPHWGFFNSYQEPMSLAEAALTSVSPASFFCGFKWFSPHKSDQF